MAAGATYEPLATTTLGSNQSSVTFSSIPGTYTDLVLVVNAGSTSTDNFAYLEFNTDTSGNNYSWTTLYGNGSSAGSARNNSIGYICAYVGIGTSLDTTIITNIQNYSNSSTYKTWLSRSNRVSTGGTYYGTEALVGNWHNASAITSVKVNAYSTFSFITGSTFTLFGIAAA